MNRVFLLLVLAAVLAALGQDVVGVHFVDVKPEQPAPALALLTERLLDSASSAAKLSLGLIGILALWMGLMRVAEQAGLVPALARLLRPLLVRLFPDVPKDHPAMGAMVMNLAANLLGLGNAATPLGLEAMKQLQRLNPHRQTATNAMCLFLAINTSGLTLIPARAITLRAENGSLEPTAILLPTLLATAASTITAIVVAKLLAPRFPVEPDAPEAAAAPGQDPDEGERA